MPLKDDGQVYNFNGKEIRLYTTSAIVSELERNGMKRSAQTIRKWEKQGVIPPTGFRHGSKRLYTETYIRRLVEVLADSGMKQNNSVRSAEWKNGAWEALVGHGALFVNFPPKTKDDAAHPDNFKKEPSKNQRRHS